MLHTLRVWQSVVHRSWLVCLSVGRSLGANLTRSKPPKEQTSQGIVGSKPPKESLGANLPRNRCEQTSQGITGSKPPKESGAIWYYKRQRGTTGDNKRQKETKRDKKTQTFTKRSTSTSLQTSWKTSNSHFRSQIVQQISSPGCFRTIIKQEDLLI